MIKKVVRRSRLHDPSSARKCIRYAGFRLLFTAPGDVAAKLDGGPSQTERRWRSPQRKDLLILLLPCVRQGEYPSHEYQPHAPAAP